jgi:ketosteroid isomerase-like protein
MSDHRMKLLVLTFVLLSTFGSVYAQPSPDHIELTRALNEFLAGASRNDADVHDRFWAEDLIYTRSSGARTNKTELMKGVRSAAPRKEGDPVTVYTAEEVQIKIYGDAAVVAFKLVGTTTSADGKKSITNHLNTGTFIKRNGKWQAVAWQATTVPTPQTANVTQPATTTKPVAPSTEKPSTEKTDKPQTEPADRTYVKGPRGGCYYVNPSGSKVYVDKKFCL